MVSDSPPLVGMVPSLDALPFFAMDSTSVFLARPFASYGEIARTALTRRIAGGLLPWEIFVAEVLALPGQRDCWKVGLFLEARPPELVLREKIHRTSGGKLPPRLALGIESRNSPTLGQTRDWLAKFPGEVAVDFTMLPVGLMLQALAAKTLDGIVAAPPWGRHAEAAGLGKRVAEFPAKKSHHLLAVFYHRDFPLPGDEMLGRISIAWKNLETPELLQQASTSMTHGAAPEISGAILTQAMRQSDIPSAMVPDLTMLTTALSDTTALSSSMAAREAIARLLLPD